MKAYLGFLDESGLLLVPTVRRTWAPRGQTPTVRHRYRRNKIAAISAVTLSPTRRRCVLYAQFSYDNITHVETAVFLRLLLQHLPGHIIVVMDNDSIHRGADVRALCARHPRLHLDWFPSYAPALNPDELVWSCLKGQLANGGPDDIEELMEDSTPSPYADAPARLHSWVRTGVPLFLATAFYCFCKSQHESSSEAAHSPRSRAGSKTHPYSQLTNILALQEIEWVDCDHFAR